MNRLTPKRLEEIRSIHALITIQDENPLKVLDELLAEIDALESEKTQVLKNYQELHHDFAVTCGHYNKALKERDRLKERVAKLREALQK